jgi:hypothetical protein
MLDTMDYRLARRAATVLPPTGDASGWEKIE